jgi:UDP-N-acetylmuramate--alanine ligase
MKKNILEYNLYYFLGIGGIGVSALARYFNHYKKKCAGYDKTPTHLTAQLESEGIEIHYDENTEYLEYLLSDVNKEEVLIVNTPAIPTSHLEYKWLVKNNFTIKKRSEVLGAISENYKTIAIAGTHGKTTISTMVAHILKSSGVNCFAFLGGISNNYNTNLLLGDEQSREKAFMVVEADEYDRSFLTLNPDGAVITSVDPDHLDIYGDATSVLESFTQFASQVKSDGRLIVKNSVDNTLSLKKERYTYSVISDPDLSEVSFCAKNIRVDKAEFYFDYKSPFSSLNDFHIAIPGNHNVENAVAASAICECFGIPISAIKNALTTFKGVKRRFEYRIKKPNLVFVDDYAHHPEELNAVISAARKLYPEKKITGIFQPHLYSRTRDFANEFADALDKLDHCFLLPIYPARETPIKGIDSEMLLSKMKIKYKKVVDKAELLDCLKNENLEVLLTLGAGDVDALVVPIEKMLNEKNI